LYILRKLTAIVIPKLRAFLLKHQEIKTVAIMH